MKPGAATLAVTLACLLTGACSIEKTGLARVDRDAGRAGLDAGNRDSGRRDTGADAIDACAGCECDTAADCAGETRDPWGACGEFSGPCDATGIESRDVHAWLCEGGRCVENVITESQSCTRDVEGTACGSTSPGAWSDCTYSDDCDETGSQSRSVTGMFCRGGGCMMETTTEERGCSRDTGGDFCTEADGCSGRCAFGSCATACIDCGMACPSSCSGYCSGTGLDRCCKCNC